MEKEIESFVCEMRKCLADSTFVKLTLGNYKGADEHLQRIYVRPVKTRAGERLLFQYKGKTSDIAKNSALIEGPDLVERYLFAGFRSGHLFTTANDFQLTIGKRSAKLTKGKPTFRTAETRKHDREKKYLIDPNAFYLKALGVTTEKGEIRSDQRDKWKQINKFVEILGRLYENSDLKEKSSLKIVDMGSGKGYLTFALYDFLIRATSEAKFGLSVTGVEQRRELVDLCNEIAQAAGFEGLNFVQDAIAAFDPGNVDILIALHACDTATDDALYKGLTSNASIIVVAPCCHKEVKNQLRSPDLFAGVLKHPLMLERTAEILTDGIRSMILEAKGYKTKMFEFVSTEHTPKNNMIVATRYTERVSAPIEARIAEIRNMFGVERQHLADLLERSKD